MRHDMSKIITEPARHSVSYYRALPNDYRRAKHFKLTEDFDVNDEYTVNVNPMRSKKSGWDNKSPIFAYRTINRFLNSNVGRPWNDVYSEICKQHKSAASKSQKLLELFRNKVKVNTYISAAGYICYCSDYGGNEVVEGTFYVHPISRILCKAERESYRSLYKARISEKNKKQALTLREINGVSFEKINDVWFQVLERDDFHVATRKRTLSKKEIKLYGLT